VSRAETAAAAAAAADRLLTTYGGSVEDASAEARRLQLRYSPGTVSWRHYSLVLELIVGEAPPTPASPRTFIVTGRIAFDDEDRLVILDADSIEAAKLAAEQTWREESAVEDGDWSECYITHVVECPAGARPIHRITGD
jgi:hypothetical protein